MTAAALEGVRVVEFGAFAAGPAIGKHLADHGAQVVHVESRQRPDGFRFNYPPFKDGRGGTERAGMFALTNNGKLGVTLNLKLSSGLDVARRLAGWADVLIENFTPGTMSRLQLSYEELSEVNPRLVYLSTCNQGQSGPYAQRPGFGTHLTAQAGFIDVTGWPDRDPSLLWGPYIDYIAVAYGAVCVLAALDLREQTGRGGHIDLSQYETGLQFMAPALVDFFATGRVASRAGNRHPTAAPHGIYPCLGEDSWCALSVHDDAEWQRLRTAMGHPAWAQDASMASAAGRQERESEIDRHLESWTSRLPRDEAVARLRSAGVHTAPVNDMADLYRDPQLRERRVWRPVDHPVLGRHSAEGPPFLLSETPAVLERPAPLLGEHNREVFCGLLGLSESEYEACAQDGTFD